MEIRAHKQTKREYYSRTLARPSRVLGITQTAHSRVVTVWGYSINGGPIIWGFDRKRDALAAARQ